MTLAWKDWVDQQTGMYHESDTRYEGGDVHVIRSFRYG